MADQEGQSPQAKEWVARRDAADRAIENVRRRTEEEEGLKRHDAEVRVQESPILFIIGIICAGIVIVGGLWWFITAVQCDPMISDRAFSSACK
ncbi:MAG TPA: hypothetical protein VMU31_04660 [Rhizomicrobium sp.]|nr:hypothetical protein [Rhizomicrobium sp.]